MTSSFLGLHKCALIRKHARVRVHTHTLIQPFLSALGTISVDTISGIRIFALKGISLAQGHTLGISLSSSFFPFFPHVI